MSSDFEHALYLEQKLGLDDSKTVLEIVEEGVQEIVHPLAEFDEINAKFAEELTLDEMNALIKRQDEAQERLDRLNARDLDSRLDLAMNAMPTWRYTGGGAVGARILIYHKRLRAASKVNEYRILLEAFIQTTSVTYYASSPSRHCRATRPNLLLLFAGCDRPHLRELHWDQ